MLRDRYFSKHKQIEHRSHFKTPQNCPACRGQKIARLRDLGTYARFEFFSRGGASHDAESKTYFRHPKEYREFFLLKFFGHL